MRPCSVSVAMGALPICAKLRLPMQRQPWHPFVHVGSHYCFLGTRRSFITPRSRQQGPADLSFKIMIEIRSLRTEREHLGPSCQASFITSQGGFLLYYIFSRSGGLSCRSYLRDYPIERYLRDLRVHSILEGDSLAPPRRTFSACPVRCICPLRRTCVLLHPPTAHLRCRDK